MRTALIWDMKRQIVVIIYRHFGKTYRSHFKRSGIQDDSCPFKIGQISCPETSAKNYHYSLRNNPEERSSHLLRGGSLK